jgi:hypothetical protein
MDNNDPVLRKMNIQLDGVYAKRNGFSEPGHRIFRINTCSSSVSDYN